MYISVACSYRARKVLYLRFRRIGDCFRRLNIRNIEADHANPIVGHPVIDIEAVRWS